jgi:hypothetical protein
MEASFSMSDHRGGSCHVHRLPLVQHHDRWLCKFCEVQRYASLNTFRLVLGFCEWGIVLTMPLLAFALAALAPLGRDVFGGLSHIHYLALAGPAAFISAVMSSLLGRVIFGFVAAPLGGMSRWYNATHLGRDWLLFALSVAVPYVLLLYLGDGIVGVADTPTRYYLTRAPFLIGVSAASLYLMNKNGLVTPQAMLPRRGEAWSAVVYGVILALGFLYMQLWLSGLVRSHQPTGAGCFVADLRADDVPGCWCCCRQNWVTNYRFSFTAIACDGRDDWSFEHWENHLSGACVFNAGPQPGL